METVIHVCGWYLILVTVVNIFMQRTETVAGVIAKALGYSAFMIVGLRAVGII
jgi:uncharacterized protein YebE (UPF0316 family)